MTGNIHKQEGAPDTYHGIVEGALVEMATRRRAAPKVEFIHDQLIGLIGSRLYPCVGAKAAFNRNAYRLGMYAAMDDADTARRLATDLERFAVDRPRLDDQYSTFLACFDGPHPTGELHFEQCLWNLLQVLADRDVELGRPHDPTATSDPSDPYFGFSYGGIAYFLVGLNPSASRWSRRFAWPTIVFNVHSQFAKLRAEAQFEPMKEKVRKRDIALQGSRNPQLAGTKEVSEAIQYSGRRTEPGWQCPFKRKQ